MAFMRGNVYYIDLGYGEKPYLVVSNNGRNRALGSALCVRITTTTKTPRTTVIPLSHFDPMAGLVLCDNVETLFDSDSSRHGGALSPATMAAVGAGLKAALALT